MSKAAKDKDALDQLIDKFVGGDPARQRMLVEEIINTEASQLVYDLRTRAGLIKGAKKVGAAPIKPQTGKNAKAR